MSQSCSEEFSRKNFSLEYLTPQSFVNSQWCIPQVIYFIWRVVAAIFFIVGIIIMGVVDIDIGSSQPNRLKGLIYLTIWAFILLMINTIIEMVTVGMALLKGSTYHDMPWFYKMSWVVYNVATTAGLLVTIGYWAILYPNIGSSAIDYANIGTHAVNSIYILINLFITGMPVRIQHFWHCLVLSVVYILFSVIYHVSGGTSPTGDPYIYSVLDWNNPETAIIYAIMLGIVAPIVLWLIVYGLYWVRVAIFRGCKHTKNFTVDNTVMQSDIALNSDISFIQLAVTGLDG